MTVHSFLPRILRYHLNEEEREAPHSFVNEVDDNVVVLAEAGMGKSRLLEQFQSGDAALVSARKLVNAADPKKLLGSNTLLLIDALDEAPSVKAGDAVDGVIGALERCGYPRFILACRVDDWREATAKASIREHYGEEPLQMHIKPFDQDQIERFLTDGLGAEKAQATYKHYADRGLQDWLGNPQTLIMIERVARDLPLPDATRSLFENYVDLCWPEHNNKKAEMEVELPNKETVLDALGAIFATLILSGNRAFTTRQTANPDDAEISLPDIRNLPGGSDWQHAIRCRLVVNIAGDTKRFTYIHRRIGEYLGARWIAKYADTQDKRERLLTRLNLNNVVPANMRGIFGWLSIDPYMAEKVILADPMAVIEYADADSFDTPHAAILLNSLRQLSERHPWFRGWNEYRARSLVQGDMLNQTMPVILDNSKGFRLRLTLMEQLTGEQLPAGIILQLRDFLLEQAYDFALRRAAGDALIGNIADQDWVDLVEKLRLHALEDSMRLASEFVVEAGLEKFSDDQIVDVIFAYGSFSLCAVPAEGENNHMLRFYRFRSEIKDERIDGFLDLLTDYCRALFPEYRDLECGDIISLGKSLIARRLNLGSVDPIRLWRWISGLGDRHSFTDSDNKMLTNWFSSNDEDRRAIQRHVLLQEKDPTELRMKAYRMAEMESALFLSEDDVIDLLKHISPPDQRWRDIVCLVGHREQEGSKLREAAKTFAAHEGDGVDWLSKLANRPKHDWEIENEERASKRKTEREARWAELRADYLENRHSILFGRYRGLIGPARAYMGRYSDVGRDLPPHQRIAKWLGDDLQQDAFDGFEAYLNILPAFPQAYHFAQSHSKSKQWPAGYILLAALAERVRTGRGVDSVDAERLIAAQLEIANHMASGDEFESLRDAIWTELLKRGTALETYARYLVEPNLRKRREHVSGLYQLMRDPPNRSLSIRLALDWLYRFPRMSGQSEEEIIDLLLRSDQAAALIPISKRRLRSTALDGRRRRNWNAVQLIVDFPGSVNRFPNLGVDKPEMLWVIRSRLGSTLLDGTPLPIFPQLAAWMILQFRSCFPVEERPGGSTMGDTNPWDATDYISNIINRLGDDISDRSIELLARLVTIEDGYQDRIMSAHAEQQRKRAEQDYAPISAPEIQTILQDGLPHSLSDLQHHVLKLLKKVEDQVGSNDTDSWRGLFDHNGVPHEEERCRDHLVDLLRQHDQRIDFAPEGHVGEDREIDIDCKLPGMRLPVEIKGQWHPKLWTEADCQLGDQQAVDHLAQGYGIYLVLWFGNKKLPKNKTLQNPPVGLRVETPKTPEQLQAELSKNLSDARRGRIQIKVLDLTHEFK